MTTYQEDRKDQENGMSMGCRLWSHLLGLGVTPHGRERHLQLALHLTFQAQRRRSKVSIGRTAVVRRARCGARKQRPPPPQPPGSRDDAASTRAAEA